MAELIEKDIVEINNFAKKVRKEIVEMIYTAKSGHPGGNLSAVEIISTLYLKCMKHYPDWKNNSEFKDRDRFVLSKGHASACLYAVLANCGYLSTDELLTFRQLGTRLQGHPSVKHLDGIEVSTGSLGQGLSLACGIALGLKLDKINSNVFVYMGDGELQEGNIWEAVMNAAHNKLDNIIAFVDKNNLQIDGCTDDIKSMTPLDEKFKAFGWECLTIDGHNPSEIYNAVETAKLHSKPTVIIANTIKGKGVSFMENKSGWHGKAPNKEEFELAMSELSE